MLDFKACRIEITTRDKTEQVLYSNRNFSQINIGGIYGSSSSDILVLVLVRLSNLLVEIVMFHVIKQMAPILIIKPKKCTNFSNLFLE
jgi:hypothetical protein